MKFALEVPLGPVSFGQVANCILFELYKRDISPSIFPIANVDLSAYSFGQDYEYWLVSNIKKAAKHHKRETPVLKLWHLNGSMHSVSTKQILLTFHETDKPTEEEKNVARNQSQLILTNDYSASHFESSKVVPLGFDETHFKKLDKIYHTDRIVFTLTGKLEKRKHHAKIIRVWNKKFGGNRKYMLNCGIFNPFMQNELQNQILTEALDGNMPYNIKMNPWCNSNAAFNDLLNCGNVAIGMSGGEGWDLCTFNSLCLGKHAVVLNAHAYKEYITPENSVLVEPSGMIDAVDGIFFLKDQPWNQGKIFTWDDDAFIAGCEEAIKRYEAAPLNKAGEALKEKFTWSNTVDQLLKIIEEV